MALDVYEPDNLRDRISCYLRLKLVRAGALLQGYLYICQLQNSLSCGRPVERALIEGMLRRSEVVKALVLEYVVGIQGAEVF